MFGLCEKIQSVLGKGGRDRIREKNNQKKKEATTEHILFSWKILIICSLVLLFKSSSKNSAAILKIKNPKRKEKRILFLYAEKIVEAIHQSNAEKHELERRENKNGNTQNAKLEVIQISSGETGNSAGKKQSLCMQSTPGNGLSNGSSAC
ncbi:hypothetical protein CEXT_440161 [Caerostris extrusa]|uniref:Uncharacterized protein n=1 Tax=Caerostris extrusa TaxID=172846 RepID=A0AAV4XK45_CAEEX|nr:hypothetical protein CEXT_440161 [Caerostris extrusa]